MAVYQFSARAAKKMRNLLLICGAAALSLPGVARAATVRYSLADLLSTADGGTGQNPNGFVIGDKRYSDFTFDSSGSAPLVPRDVNVRVTSTDTDPTVAGDDRFALQFTFGLDAFPGEETDLVLGYRVDVLDPAMAINRVGLRFNGAVPAEGAGFAAASVSETVRNPDGSDVVLMDVTTDPDGAGPLKADHSDFLAINPTRSLVFQKDILVSSRETGGYAVISVVDNIVDQVPEPTVMSLAAFAGAGLLLRRRR